MSDFFAQDLISLLTLTSCDALGKSYLKLVTLEMEFEIYIKDNCFLPDNTDIKINTKVFFKNTDSIRHTIHCKGHAYFPSLIIEAGHTAVFNFDKPGRYEISEAILGDMKVGNILK